MPTLLEQLRTMTTVVADTGDIDSIQAFTPTDSTTNPSLLASAAKKREYQPIVDAVLETAQHRECASIARNRTGYPASCVYIRVFTLL